MADASRGDPPAPTPAPSSRAEAHFARLQQALSERLGHRFERPELLSQALTHRSAASGHRQLDSNERLEFLGDRVLALAMAEWLSERFPAEREGELGRRLAVLVAADTLAKVGEAIGLGEALRVPPAEGRTGLRNRVNVLADATEALIGALFLDAGLDAARRFVRAEWDAHVAADARPPTSSKNRVQEWTLGRGLGLPTYRIEATTGPSHAPVFHASVTAAGRTVEATGDTKQAAEQAAAAAWLREAGHDDA